MYYFNKRFKSQVNLYTDMKMYLTYIKQWIKANCEEHPEHDHIFHKNKNMAISTDVIGAPSPNASPNQKIYTKQN